MTKVATPEQDSVDPVAGQREPDEDPFAAQKGDEVVSDTAGSLLSSPTNSKNRRGSKEWGKYYLRSKAQPGGKVTSLMVCLCSYQTLLSSILTISKTEEELVSTPGSRDSYIDSSKSRDRSFHDKLKEKGRIK
ncbi:MAG: hypothetical protein LQ340_007466 [Diploschistes diacapsis]|nr:MAG: hypothetical protein LQ340_007466 [Diploschistes diacapsis]